MRVKAPPIRLRCDSLSAPTDQTRFLEGKAGNRAQSDSRCGLTLVLTGSPHGETEPQKATYLQAGRNNKTLTSLENTPPSNSDRIGKSPGVPVVEVATPNGIKQSTKGTKKNELRVKGRTLP